MESNKLEPIGARRAYELYLDDCENELSPNTIEAKRYRIGFFVDWCEGATNVERGTTDTDLSDVDDRISNLNELSGRDIIQYKNWRKDGLKTVSLKTQLSELRTFLRFCVSIDAVDESVPANMQVPKLDKGENVRETMMSEEEATTLCNFLERYHYASLDHVLILLLWQMGARMSGVYSLDVDDIDTENNRITVEHRPDDGTRLKNKEDGERVVTVPESTISILEDYVEVNRTPVKDDYERRPLLSSDSGRMDKRTLSKHVYKWTCPCQYNESCPADKYPYECEYTGSLRGAVKCPHNTRPHDIRRGSITTNLRKDVPERAISDRMNVSINTLDRHYDERTETEKAEQRREWFNED